MAGCHGVLRKLGYTAVTLGFLACVAGAIPNLWLTGKVQLGDLQKLVDISVTIRDDTALADVESGLWWFCYSSDQLSEGSTSGCQASPYFDEDGNIDLVVIMPRLLCVVNVLLALLCSLAGSCCCSVCCLCCGDCGIILSGFLAFFSGGTGIAAVVVYLYDFHSEQDIVTFLVESEAEWAIYLYASSSGLITFAAFLLFMSLPSSVMEFTSIETPSRPTYVHLKEVASVENTDNSADNVGFSPTWLEEQNNSSIVEKY